jgi:hypothetical protein
MTAMVPAEQPDTAIKTPIGNNVMHVVAPLPFTVRFKGSLEHSLHGTADVSKIWGMLRLQAV